MQPNPPPAPTETTFPREAITTSLNQRFETQAAAYPEHIAVKTMDSAITYQDLNQQANQIAHHLLTSNLPEAPIGILLPRNVDQVAAFLAILKAGRLAVTLDPSAPVQRLQHIAADAELVGILTDQANLTTAQQLNMSTKYILDLDTLTATPPQANPNLQFAPQTPATLIYTSGSTGKPKGAVHTHETLLHNIWTHTHHLGLNHQDRIAGFSSIGHISGISAMFRALLNGGTLYLYDIKARGLTPLAAWLQTEAITIYHSVPTVFRHLLDALPPETTFPSVRVIHLGGEPVSHRDVERFRRHFGPHCRLMHNLGSTEAPTMANFFIDHNTTLEDTILPLGYAAADKYLSLLNDEGREVGQGDIGEIVVESAYLAQGYWRQPDLTAARFLDVPDYPERKRYHTGDLGRFDESGRLYHLGRKDLQTKIRGRRIELTEIELTLAQHPQVKEVAVVTQRSNGEDNQLIAFLVPNNAEQTPDAVALRQFLQPRLPDYMHPMAFLALDQMPLLPNGKVDRRNLSERPLWEDVAVPKDLPATPANPHDPLVGQLQTMWAQVLGHQTVAIDANFFDLGGNSLNGAELLARIRQTMKVDLPLSILFQTPTIGQMATLIRNNSHHARNLPPSSSLIALNPNGSRPPFFCLPGNLGNVFTDLGHLAESLGPDQPVYALQDSADNPADIKALARHYLHEVKQIQPDGPYHLGGLCAGGVVAFEMAQQLQAAGEDVALLALIEPASPRGPGLSNYVDIAAIFARRVLRRFRHHSKAMAHLKASEQKQYTRLKMKLMANSWALRQYKPHIFTGQLKLFLTEDSLKQSNNPQQRWQQFSPDTELLDLPGTHDSLTGNNDTPIEPDHMQVLAQKLTPFLTPNATASVRYNR